MENPLKILLLEDSPDDAELILRELRQAGFLPEWKRVECEADFLAELRTNPPEIIFSDFSMPTFTGLEAVKLLRKEALDIPFILISGTVGEEVAVEAMKHGASDYLLKDRIARLSSAVERVLGEKRLHQTQRQAELEKGQLEEQLRQSQKMEAIGQLAGGVAHDFNNILAIIQMQAGVLRLGQNLPSEIRECAGEIEKAAQRGANLTRQLLLFSRRQAMQPGDVDLNEIVNSIAKMLQRVLSENIEMQFKLAPEPLFIHADAGMMDQVLLNLAVNSRDAMPKGGQIVVETSSVEFHDDAMSKTLQMQPGTFACLKVTDNGGGIAPELLPRIFEPFFTTKQTGKGTGLGLATVFGIVRQHQGWINVHSEVGRGTTFRIYLPRLAAAKNKPAKLPLPASVRGGNETILLVEDEPALRKTAQIALSRLGYHVLEASDGTEALSVWQTHHDEIRLLLTDLVMPGEMNGKELARQLQQQNPKLEVLYVSGYSEEFSDENCLLEEGVNFLCKPFAASKLAKIVREKLDAIN